MTICSHINTIRGDEKMNINLIKPMKATISVAQELSQDELFNLTGDIENWLATKKSIICKNIQVI